MEFSTAVKRNGKKASTDYQDRCRGNEVRARTVKPRISYWAKIKEARANQGDQCRPGQGLVVPIPAHGVKASCCWLLRRRSRFVDVPGGGNT